MTGSDFDKLVKGQLTKCETLLCSKGKEYSPSVDRLSAFRKAADLQGETMKQALCGMLAKHIVSVFDMCMGNDDFTDARWDEKITDSINYFLLLVAVVKEESHAKTDEKPQR